MKAIGLLILFLSAVSVGVFFSAKNKKQISDLKDMTDFLKYIRNRIVYFNEPLNIIYNGYKASTASFSSFLNSTCNDGFEKALLSRKELSFSDNTMEILVSVGKELGKSFKDKQTALLDDCINRLEKEGDELKSEAAQKNKLYISMGIYVGLLLVILFL